MPTPLWEQLEDQIIALTGGRPTKASGRLAEKGDVHTETLLIECKHRTHKGPKYAANAQQDWFDTVLQHADDAEKIPLLVCGLTWSREERIDHRIVLCLKRDLAAFTEREDINPYLGLPFSWAAITDESLVEYCRIEQLKVQNGQTPKARPAHTMGGRPMNSGRPMGGGRPMSGGRPMNNGGSRFGR